MKCEDFSARDCKMALWKWNPWVSFWTAYFSETHELAANTLKLPYVSHKFGILASSGSSFERGHVPASTESNVACTQGETVWTQSFCFHSFFPITSLTSEFHLFFFGVTIFLAQVFHGEKLGQARHVLSHLFFFFFSTNFGTSVVV